MHISADYKRLVLIHYNNVITEDIMEHIMRRCCVFCSPGSLVRPKVVRSVHYCPATKKTMERKYTDMTSLDAFPSSSIYPTKVFSNMLTLLLG